MIPTYMDRADAAAGYQPTPAKPIDRDDPRYWNGSLYFKHTPKSLHYTKGNT